MSRLIVGLLLFVSLIAHSAEVRILSSQSVVRGESSGLDLAFGNLRGVSESAKHGFNGDVDTGPEHVWAYGGLRTVPSSSFTPFIASDYELMVH